MTAGAGKTTTLINVWLDLMNQGIEPEEILVISFSRSTVKELKSRMRPILQLKEMRVLDDETFKLLTTNVRTQHSLCYDHLKETKKMVSGSAFQEFCEKHGFDVSNLHARVDIWGDVTAGLDDERWQKIQRARLELKSLENEDEKTQELAFEYLAWKEEHGFIDYTDMLELCVAEQWAPEGIKAILVDEAQDMCALMHEHHKILLDSVGDGYTAWFGDEDQCIYTFMGADPRFFVEQEAVEVVYGEQSYRVPGLVAKKAAGVIGKNTMRLPKTIKGKTEEGSILYAPSPYTFVRDIEDDLKAGRSVYWLSFTNWQAHEAKNLLRVFSIPVQGTEDEENFAKARKILEAKKTHLSREEMAILMTARRGKKLFPQQKKFFVEPRRFGTWWQNVQDGKAIFPPEGLNVSEYAGFTDEMKGALLRSETGVFGEDFEWPRDMAVDKWPVKVRVMTAHAAKGMEADTVVLEQEVTGRMEQSMREDPEMARRLYFVALTRTRGRLVLYRNNKSRLMSIEELT